MQLPGQKTCGTGILVINSDEINTNAYFNLVYLNFWQVSVPLILHRHYIIDIYIIPYIYIYTCIYIYIYRYIDICIYVYMYICIHTYIHTYIQNSYPSSTAFVQLLYFLYSFCITASVQLSLQSVGLEIRLGLKTYIFLTVEFTLYFKKSIC